MAISIKNLNKDYNGHSVFEGFSIDFKDNVINCILGESGCGKTTLLNIISGLEDFGGGNITGVDNSTFSYIFQEPRLLDWYNVRRNMEYILEDSGISGWQVAAQVHCFPRRALPGAFHPFIPGHRARVRVWLWPGLGDSPAVAQPGGIVQPGTWKPSR